MDIDGERRFNLAQLESVVSEFSKVERVGHCEIHIFVRVVSSRYYSLLSIIHNSTDIRLIAALPSYPNLNLLILLKSHEVQMWLYPHTDLPVIIQHSLTIECCLRQAHWAF